MRPDKGIQHTELGGDPHKHTRCIGVPIKLNTTNYPIETPHTRYATADARQMPKNPQPLPWTVREWDRVKCSSAGLGRSGGPGLVALSTRILYGAVNAQYKTDILVGSTLTFQNDNSSPIFELHTLLSWFEFDFSEKMNDPLSERGTLFLNSKLF